MTRFDSSGIESVTCNLATARLHHGNIEISFGARRRAADSDALSAELLHRVSLDPVAAERLRELLLRLVNELQNFSRS